MSRRKFLQNVSKAIAVAPLSVGLIPSEEHKGNAQAVPSQRELEDHTRLLRSRLLNDPLRPHYHFVSPEGHAMPFDPNGAIFWKGKYHLGYIYQHNNEKGQRIHYWGHVVSHDLFHWSVMPPMLDVKNGDPETGIFSGGSFLSKDGVPHVVYHGTGAGNSIARAKDDDLMIWEKFEQNPVIPVLKENIDIVKHSTNATRQAWDPHCWLEGDTYYQISGGNPPGLFKSTDLIHWSFVGNFMDESKRKQHEFEDWSCPDFFTLGNKRVSVAISHNLGTQYYIGEFLNEQFVPEKHGRMNWPGGTFFAPETLLDNKGRRILWGWVLDRRPYSDEQGWSGVMSLPRVLALSAAGDMLISPPAEVVQLRYNEVIPADVSFTGDQEETVENISGNCFEWQLEISAKNANTCGVKVLCSPDGKEETVIRYDFRSNELVIDFINSKAPGNVRHESYCMMGYYLKTVPEFVSEQRAPLVLKKGENLRLDIFVDKSIIEVFANGRQCITQRVYPSLSSSTLCKVFSKSGKVEIKKAKFWQMAKTNFS